jgi:hypothetical protein
VIYGFFALVAVTIAVSLFDWRRGIYLCLAVGFLQDPARKLYPGRPVAFVVVVAVCFVACLAGVYLSGRRLGVRPLFGLYPRLRAPVVCFVLIVILQTAVTLLRTGIRCSRGWGCSRTSARRSRCCSGSSSSPVSATSSAGCASTSPA